MKKIYLLHTQFNISFEENVVNEEFKITEEHKRNDSGVYTMEDVGFGYSEAICVIHYDNGLKVNFNDPNLDSLPDELLILISDELYLDQRDIIRNRLNDLLLNTECHIYTIAHQRSQFAQFVEDINDSFETKLKCPILKVSHIENDTNPFYALVNLVNSSCKEEFLASLNIIKATFPTEKEVQEIDDLNEKLNVLYKLLGNDLSKAELKKLPIVTTDIKVDRVQYIREVREKMFKKF